MARQYINEKTGRVVKSNLRPDQARKYGYILHEEPEVKKPKPRKTKPKAVKKQEPEANELPKKEKPQPRKID